MAGRTRTTKKLAQRIDRAYFKSVYPITRWRRLLSIALVLVGILWLGWRGFARDETPYTSGPLTHTHAVLGQNCAACHAQAGFSHAVSDRACQSCHDGPPHQAAQTFTPSCGTCHVEHQEAARLTSVSDRGCTQCHANLRTNKGALTVAANVTSFGGGHPEFRALRNGATDPGTVKFNHELHLEKELRGPTGTVQLRCTNCHQWELPGTAVPVAVRSRAKGNMAPVSYAVACASCHPLSFDERIARPAPHQDPEKVHAFVVDALQQYIVAHPQELRANTYNGARIPGRTEPAMARTNMEWVKRRTEEAEGLLWSKTCRECHTVTFSPNSEQPQIAKAGIPASWLKHGNFDHSAHQLVECASCHAKALSSTSAADILIPSVNTCRDCHRPGTQTAGNQCSECHVYHNWSKERMVDSRRTLQELLKHARM